MTTTRRVARGAGIAAIVLSGATTLAFASIKWGAGLAVSTFNASFLHYDVFRSYRDSVHTRFVVDSINDMNGRRELLDRMSRLETRGERIESKIDNIIAGQLQQARKQ
jgi:hypothetical protein